MSTAVATIALPASAAVIWALLRSPLARRIVNVPTGDRWSAAPTPSLGGIGIFAGFTIGLWAAVAVGAFHPGKEFVGVFAAITLVFAAGLADDLYGMPPLGKLATQLVAAAIVIATGTHVQLIHNQVVGDAIAVIWLIGLTNAFNLLDNMDGLAATLAAIAFGFFAIDALTIHASDATLAYALAGGLACVGFLPFNLRKGPALVFMGDSGSQMVGFALAALGLTASWRVAGTTVATLVLPILILAVPILDTTLVTVARLLDGRPIHEGGRDHTSHRLVRYGLSERHAVALLALISLCIGGSSLAYTVLDNFRLTVIGVLATFVLLVQFASFLADVDRRPAQLGEPLGLAQAFGVHWRRLVEVIVDFFVITASFTAAYVIDFGWPGTDSQRFIRDLALPIVLTTCYLTFIPFGLYRSVWRFAGIRDAISAALAVVVAERRRTHVHGADPGHARLRRLVLHRQHPDLHGRDHRLALRRADAPDRDAVGARPHRPADADRRRGPDRPQPDARAPRDRRREGRRLRRRQPAPSPPQPPGREDRRSDLRAGTRARAHRARHRADHDPRRAA